MIIVNLLRDQAIEKRPNYAYHAGESTKDDACPQDRQREDESSAERLSIVEIEFCQVDKKESR